MNLRLPLLLIVILSASFAMADRIMVSLHASDFPEVGKRHVAAPVSYDPANALAEFTSAGFNIKVESTKGDMKYSVFAEDSCVLRVAFPEDSVSNWRVGRRYDLHAMRFQHNDDSYFLIPGTVINYNDTVYNHFPLMISDGSKSATIEDGNVVLYVVGKDGNGSLRVLVKEGNEFHDDAISGGKSYKKEYALGDTIPISDVGYVLEDVDLEDSRLTLSQIDIIGQTRKIAPSMFRQLFSASQDKDLMFVDFWGTWCAPCIASIPHIKELHDRYGDMVQFVSICYDSPENYGKSYEILDKYGVCWERMFISDKETDSMISKLEIESFPTFLLIDKDGNLLERASGETSLPRLSDLLESLVPLKAQE